MKGKICYFLLILITMYLNIMYIWPFGTVVLGWEIVLLICSVCLSTYFKRMLQVSIQSDKMLIAQKGEELQLEMELFNKSIFPITQIHIVLECHYLCGQQTTEMKLRAVVDAKEKNTVVCRVIPEYSGKLVLTIKKVKVSDYLGISSRTKPVDRNSQILVMPRLYDVVVKVSNQTRMFYADSDHYDKSRRGDDPSEVFDIRTYRPGDSLQRIHWKISAKEEELYVKEYSLPVGTAVVCLIESTGNEKKLSQVDEFVEAVLSFSQQLLMQHCMHYVVWKQKNKEEMTRILLQKEEDYEVLLAQMLSWDITEAEADIEQLYKQTYLRDSYHTVIRFCSAQKCMKVIKNGILECEWEVDQVKSGMQAVEFVV